MLKANAPAARTFGQKPKGHWLSVCVSVSLSVLVDDWRCHYRKLNAE